MLPVVLLLLVLQLVLVLLEQLFLLLLHLLLVVLVQLVQQLLLQLVLLLLVLLVSVQQSYLQLVLLLLSLLLLLLHLVVLLLLLQLWARCPLMQAPPADRQHACRPSACIHAWPSGLRHRASPFALKSQRRCSLHDEQPELRYSALRSCIRDALTALKGRHAGLQRAAQPPPTLLSQLGSRCHQDECPTELS